MKDIVKGITLRGVLEFLMPAAYLVGMLVALASSSGLLLEYNLENPSQLPYYLLFLLDEVAMGAFFFVLVLLVGIFLHVLNLPERLPFYRDALAVEQAAKKLTAKYLRIGMCCNSSYTSQLHNAFFTFFERATAEQKNRTHKLVNLYSIAINVAIASLVLVPLSVGAHFAFEADFFENYGLFLVFILLFSTLGAYGLFFSKGGIKYIFERQFEAFMASPEFRALDEYFKENFVQVSRRIGGEGAFFTR
ncbi:MAG: hypothetical protein LBU92_02360 [Prevotellaceae bacterium]|jgi:hypothetical protein|nr:hypothetical protein [Prevotellaceae bacterium]